MRVIVTLDRSGAWTLKCPQCGAHNSLVEIDRAVRWNNMSDFEVVNGELRSVVWHEGQTDFEHDYYVCGACRTEIELPDNIREAWS